MIHPCVTIPRIVPIIIIKLLQLRLTIIYIFIVYSRVSITATRALLLVGYHLWTQESAELVLVLDTITGTNTSTDTNDYYNLSGIIPKKFNVHKNNDQC